MLSSLIILNKFLIYNELSKGEFNYIENQPSELLCGASHRGHQRQTFSKVIISQSQRDILVDGQACSKRRKGGSSRLLKKRIAAKAKWQKDFALSPTRNSAVSAGVYASENTFVVSVRKMKCDHFPNFSINFARRSLILLSVSVPL